MLTPNYVAVYIGQHIFYPKEENSGSVPEADVW